MATDPVVTLAVNLVSSKLKEYVSYADPAAILEKTHIDLPKDVRIPTVNIPKAVGGLSDSDFHNMLVDEIYAILVAVPFLQIARPLLGDERKAKRFIRLAVDKMLNEQDIKACVVRFNAGQLPLLTMGGVEMFKSKTLEDQMGDIARCLIIPAQFTGLYEISDPRTHEMAAVNTSVSNGSKGAKGCDTNWCGILLILAIILVVVWLIMRNKK